tara:strand:+ start:82 stop:294 length:213 start_codon:yes stop_codon:yes gene_type:complete
MTKKSRLKSLREENRKEAQESSKKAKKIASEKDIKVIGDPKNLKRKGVITFKVEDIVVGRSIYDIMESIE